MKDLPQNIQDRFLNTVRRENIPVSIIVTNGYQINNARITAFDNFVLMITTEDGDKEKTMMLFKHAISSIIPSQNVDLSPAKEEK